MRGLMGEADPIAAQFSLYNMEDYDTYYPHHAWSVGIKSTFPLLLKNRLVASIVATQMGSASVDYVLKRYFPKEPEEAINPTKGEEANEFILKSHSVIHGIVERLTEHSDDNVGRIMAELTMLRQQHSTKCFLYMANRGVIFEGHSLLRMQLEQFAWILAVDRNGDPDKVQKVKAQSSLKLLDGVIPGTAKLYGQLSAHAHWSYDAHVRAVTSEGGRLGVLYASVMHKAELLQYGILFAGLLSKIVLKLRQTEVSQLDDGTRAVEQLEGLYRESVRLSSEIAASLGAAAHD